MQSKIELCVCVCVFSRGLIVWESGFEWEKGLSR